MFMFAWGSQGCRASIPVLTMSSSIWFRLPSLCRRTLTPLLWQVLVNSLRQGAMSFWKSRGEMKGPVLWP